MKRQSEIDLLIDTLRLSAEVMEPEAYKKVCEFVGLSQLPTGAFIDRGDHADWYYTMFGYLICRAFNLNEELKKLECLVLSTKTEKKNIIDRAVWSVLFDMYRPNLLFRVKTSFWLGLLWLRGFRSTQQIYLTFLSLIILNHFWGWDRCISRQIEEVTSPLLINEQSPTSHFAAAICIRHQAKLDTSELSQELLKKINPNGGFLPFQNHSTADLLSTAVAVYSLNRAGVDLGKEVSAGLHFVSDQFDRGAFLSGDGDLTRDLEYTFYGLLALGSYSQQLKQNNK